MKSLRRIKIYVLSNTLVSICQCNNLFLKSKEVSLFFYIVEAIYNTELNICLYFLAVVYTFKISFVLGLYLCHFILIVNSGFKNFSYYLVVAHYFESDHKKVLFYIYFSKFYCKKACVLFILKQKKNFSWAIKLRRFVKWIIYFF